jgi:hypothetical protein
MGTIRTTLSVGMCNFYLGEYNKPLHSKEHPMRRILTALAALSCSFSLMAAKPLVGTWKLNIEKSKLRNPLQSEIMKIEETTPNTYRVTLDSVTATGEKRHQEIAEVRSILLRE